MRGGASLFSRLKKGYKKGIKKAPNLGRSACRLFIGVGLQMYNNKLTIMITVKINEYWNEGPSSMEYQKEFENIKEAQEYAREQMKKYTTMTSIVIECQDPKEKITIAR